ncbi:hypothetical protein GGX14DRAFT_575347 [Mycena pura]|uniref:Uncharacterized protein n=1 Tax=Mycena pura TaxID=153505 RepID=A0AAD6Y0V3_9AGAR|nr:hypothetical protein GGX14DRAFT_575347 [Mycena pura]
MMRIPQELHDAISLEVEDVPTLKCLSLVDPQFRGACQRTLFHSFIPMRRDRPESRVAFLQQSPHIAGYITNLELDMTTDPGSAGLLMRILPILVSVIHFELIGEDWSCLPPDCAKAILAFCERQHLQYLHVEQFRMAFYTVLRFARLAPVVAFHEVVVPAFMDVHLPFFNKPRQSPPLRRLSWIPDSKPSSVSAGTLLTREEFAPDMAELRVLEVMVDELSWVVVANMMWRCMRTVEAIRIHLHHGALAFTRHRTISCRNDIIVPAGFIERIPHLSALRRLEFAIDNTPSSWRPSWLGLYAVLLSPATVPALTELTFTYINLCRTTSTNPSKFYIHALQWYPLECYALAKLDCVLHSHPGNPRIRWLLHPTVFFENEFGRDRHSPLVLDDETVGLAFSNFRESMQKEMPRMCADGRLMCEVYHGWRAGPGGYWINRVD